MKFRPRMLFTLAVVVFSTYAVLSAWDWPFATKIFPWIVGIPLIVLSVIQLTREMLQSRSASAVPKEDTGDLQVDWSMGSRIVGGKAFRFYAWLLGFFFGIWLFGFFIAVPLYTFLYLKIAAQERWLTSFGLSLATFIFFVALFDQILHLPWSTPLIDAPEKLLRGVIPQFDVWN